ncbi:MAG: tRNA modification GTPase [Planctomycetes bacterium]|nr:tRNA modification GTPase [Planctomycetota bacterium]
MSADTIAAIASPAGPGARGIVRISGPGARALVRALWVGAPPELVRRGLVLGRVDDGRGTQPVLFLWMPGPRSFTGEDVAELHAPGSPPLLAALFERVTALGARPARAGEFTRRAFEHGRIDLTRAEGVLELVAARNEAEARAASQLLLGGLGSRVDGVRDALDDLRALCEASLDFDEADTGHVAPRELVDRSDRVRARLAEALAFERARGAASGLPRVALAGAPNAGKSTLFNALLRTERAITSPESGTTRDVLEAEVDLDGRRVVLLDLPGLDGDARGLERAAQQGARERLAGADLVLWVVDAAAGPHDLARERRALASGVPVVLAWNQIDRPSAGAAPDPAALDVAEVVPTSGARGQGLARLAHALGAALATAASEEGGPLARELARRHVRGLECSRAELAAAQAVLASGGPLDLAAEHLRRASAGLDELRGATTAEDLLDRIFARFCLGK